MTFMSFAHFRDLSCLVLTTVSFSLFYILPWIGCPLYRDIQGDMQVSLNCMSKLTMFSLFPQLNVQFSLCFNRRHQLVKKAGDNCHHHHHHHYQQHYSYGPKAPKAVNKMLCLSTYLCIGVCVLQCACVWVCGCLEHSPRIRLMSLFMCMS